MVEVFIISNSCSRRLKNTRHKEGKVTGSSSNKDRLLYYNKNVYLIKKEAYSISYFKLDKTL